MPRWNRHLAAALVAGAGLLGAQDAHACHGTDGDARIAVCFTSLHAGIATLAFAPADVAYALDDELPPPEWAWPQTLLGGVATLGGAGVGMGLAIDDSPNRAVDILWSSGLLVLGGFYFTHGVVSLSATEEPVVPTREENVVRSVGVVPVEGGAVAMIAFVP